MATTDDLMQSVYAHFAQAYAAQTAQGAAVVAFEPLGLIPGIDPAQPAAAITALEFLSINADWLPAIGDGQYTPTERSVSGAYALMLAAAQPGPGVNVDTFNLMKAQALETMSNGKAGSSLGAFLYYPAYASPPAWYDPASPSAWSTYSYKASDPAPPPAPPSPPASTGSTPGEGYVSSVGGVSREPLMLHRPVWRLTALAEAPAASPPVPMAARAAISPAVLAQVRFHAAPALSPAALAEVHAAPALALAAGLQLRPPIDRILPIIRPIRVGVDLPPAPPLLEDNGGAQPKLQSQFTMSFDYCLVQLRRPWLSGEFLETPDWYVPGARDGDSSNGPASAVVAATPGAGSTAPAASAPASKPFDWLPTACIAIKNLVIRAGGSLDAASLGGATALGPFGFHPGAAGANGIVNPGVQIVAWICLAQPRLPPCSDPALAAPAAAAPADPPSLLSST